MRQKLIIALSLVLVFSVLFGSQLTSTASANNYKSPKPLTSPITLFQISGNVTYKIFQFFTKPKKQFAPAPGVTVEAENLFSGHTFQTTTDVNGNYVLPVNETGVYLVRPSGGLANFFVPPVEKVKVKTDGGSATNVNFQGYKFP